MNLTLTLGNFAESAMTPSGCCEYCAKVFQNLYKHESSGQGNSNYVEIKICTNPCDGSTTQSFKHTNALKKTPQFLHA